MYLYRNIKTGAVITVPCRVSGDWVLVEEPKPSDKPAPKKKKTTKAR